MRSFAKARRPPPAGTAAAPAPIAPGPTDEPVVARSPSGVDEGTGTGTAADEGPEGAGTEAEGVVDDCGEPGVPAGVPGSAGTGVLAGFGCCGGGTTGPPGAAGRFL